MNLSKYNWRVKVLDVLWLAFFIAVLVGAYTQETALFVIGLVGCFFIQGLVIEEKIDDLVKHFEGYKRDRSP